MIDYGMADDYCCEDCEMDSFKLVDHLINDIQHLASEVVRLRYSLSWHLPKDSGQTIRQEIVSDLHSSYFEHHTYHRFVSKYCSGLDPLESERYCDHLIKLGNGEESSEFRSLTF
jgi:hypothetical protein